MIITVTSPFVAPVANAGGDRTIASGDVIRLDGSRSTRDRRATLAFAWVRTGGTGSVSVPLVNANRARPEFTADILEPGADAVTHEFTLTLTDNRGSPVDTDTVMITVTSPFVVPVANAGDDRTVASGTTIALDGSGSTVDRRRTNASYSWTQTGGTGRLMTLNNATVVRPTFTADILGAGTDDVTYVFELTVTDSAGSSDTDTVMITVTSPFVAPVADAGRGPTPVSEMKVTLDGRGSTGDRRATLGYAWTRTGGSGDSGIVLTGADTAQPSFMADALEPGADAVTHEFTLTVTDDLGSPADTDTVTVTVVSLFMVPVANAGEDVIVDSGATVTLDGGNSISDHRSDLDYSWVRTGGTEGAAVSLTRAKRARARFTTDILEAGAEDVIHIFTLTVMDDVDAISTDTITVTVASPNAPPIANAGRDRTVESGATVMLDGNDSLDIDGNIVRYAWYVSAEMIDGPVVLSGEDTAQPSFTAETLVPGDADITYEFILLVADDEHAWSSFDTVTITVEAPNAHPIADAGSDVTIDNGTTVTLDGSGSEDIDGTIVSWQWTRTGGTGSSAVILTGENGSRPRFTAETLAPGVDVTHIFSLVVTDDEDARSVADTVVVTVASPNAPPVANAGPDRQVISGSSLYLLDGSKSLDIDGTIVSYEWVRTGGTGTDKIVLNNADTVQPSFRTEILATGDPDVTHIFSLVVTDDEDARSVADTVVITVTPGNIRPVANAGPDQTVLSGATVTLDGSGSSDDGSIRSYLWGRGGGTSEIWNILEGPDDVKTVFVISEEATTSFTADVLAADASDVTHVFYLIVEDDQGESSYVDSVTITVTTNLAPVANAGEDRTVVSGAAVTLDGSDSLDHDGTIDTWAWTRSDGTGGAITLTGADTAEPAFTADTLVSGADDVTHVFSLIVTDNGGKASVADTVTITVTQAFSDLAAYASVDTGVELANAAIDIRVSPSEITVQEGGSGTYQIKLGKSPRQDVIVFAESNTGEIVLKHARLTFTATNWNDWQQVRLNSIADLDTVDGVAEIRHRIVTRGMTTGLPGIVNVTIREVDPLLRPVGEYLTAHATALLNNRTGLVQFLKPGGASPDWKRDFTLNATEGSLALDGGFVRNGVWGQVTGSYTGGDSADTRSVFGSFGIHRKYSERFLAGVMLQLDIAEQNLGGPAGSIEGKGWLAGPYFAARHRAQPLYFEGRLLYGQSSHDFRFNDADLGERTGSFDTGRLLAQLRMEGEMALSGEDDGLHLTPYADLRWFEERGDAFVDHLGNSVSGQKISIGELELGSGLEFPIAVYPGALTFTGGLGLVYSSRNGDHVDSHSGGRGRVEAGFSYDLNDDTQIGFESFYDGIGASGYESYGLSLSAEMKF